MSVILETLPPTPAPTLEPLKAAAEPLLREVPALLEYRSEVDPDAEFIPKTVAGFCLGALSMGVALDLAETVLSNPHTTFAALVPGMVQRFAFMLGIVGVSASLLLVGLKVRADHTEDPLFARHWLNSIGTGAAFALMMYGPWLILNHSITINRFVAAAIMMGIMSFPALAARWTIGPARARRPA